ncbi:MAG: S8 family serine peptidase [Nitrososphaeraceae archaeon]
MKPHIRQNIARTKAPIYIVITLLILTSTLTSQIPAAMVFATVEGDEVDEELASSLQGTAEEYSDQSLDPQLTILNSSNGISCLQAPVQSVSSSDVDEDEDEDEDDKTMNVLDGDSETEWSAGDLGSFLQLDLGSVEKICSIDVSWSDGDEKSNNFVVSVSRDGTTFGDVLRSSSSGTTELIEHYGLPTKDGRYLRVTFYGDSENDEHVTLRELAVNVRSANEKPTIVPEARGEGIPFMRDPQLPALNSSNGTNNNESSIHNAPLVSDIHAMVTSAASFEIMLKGSDSDLVDHLTYYIVKLPDHGNLSTGTNSASVRYTPFEGYSGLDNFTYEAVDKYAQRSNEATVTMDINPSKHSNAPDLIGGLNQSSPASSSASSPTSTTSVSSSSSLSSSGENTLSVGGARTEHSGTVKTADVAVAGEPIKGQYIVVLKPEATMVSDSVGITADEVRAMAEVSVSKGAQILDIFNHALDGYVIKTSENMSAEIVSELRQDPRVAFVEPDQRVYALGQTIPVGVDRVDGDVSQAVSGDGSGAVDADIAILDTGIDLTHPDLNVYHEKTFVPGTSSADDDNGHGTHVAGITAAKDNAIGVVGIAPGARLWSIKVLDSTGAGSISDIIAGIDYVTAHSDEIDVVNLSFGCECSSPALDAAINNAVQAGVVFVVAAGNDHKDASSFSPARNPNVIAVSAMADSDGKCGAQGTSTKYGSDDTFASFSNYGATVDMVAPGVGILSTYKDGKYAQLSGTSMAAPHVTGGIALYESSHHGATPAQVKAALPESGIQPSSGCTAEGQGYFTGSPDEANRPLLNAKGL